MTHGTGLFKSTETQSVEKTEELKISRQDFKGMWEDDSKQFEMHTYVGNIYNRCGLYPAKYWHAPFCSGWT